MFFTTTTHCYNFWDIEDFVMFKIKSVLHFIPKYNGNFFVLRVFYD